MAINQDELSAALSEALGGRPSSEEGLDYARRILEQNMGTQGPDTSAVESLRTQQEGVLGALQKARARIMEQRGPSRGEKLLAIAAGLGQPTRTGAIGETAGNVASALQPIAQQQREFRGSRDAALSQLDLAEATAMRPVAEAELQLSELAYKQSQQNMREALKTISRGASGTRGSAGSRTREAKIKDLMEGWDYNRPDAAALVDGFVDIEIVPETGRARLINEIDKSVVEVPLGSLGDYVDESGQPIPAYAPSESSAVPGEVDRRTQEEKDAEIFVNQAFKKGASLYDMAGIGTGPVPEVLAGLSIPSSVFGGPVAEETLIARQGLRLRARDLARTLIDNPRMPVRLVEMALEEAAIEPEFLSTGPIMQSKMVALDAYLYQKYLDARRFADDTNAPEDLREAGATNSLAIGTFLRDLGVPQDARRRSPMVPLGGKEDSSMPPLDDTVPIGVSGKVWAQMSTQERQRYKFLLEESKTGVE